MSEVPVSAMALHLLEPQKPVDLPPMTMSSNLNCQYVSEVSDT
jgi:hypothetical protein